MLTSGGWAIKMGIGPEMSGVNRLGNKNGNRLVIGLGNRLAKEVRTKGDY
jgi:hypothetical protein